MRLLLFLIGCCWGLISSCDKHTSTDAGDEKGLLFIVYSGGENILEINPTDIVLYDTTVSRNGIGIHSLKLREGFYKEIDSLQLVHPVELICKIDGTKYFWSDIFFKNQSSPRYHINFRFSPSCDNEWTFNERFNDARDTLIVNVQNECNSIEFFHMRDIIENGRTRYYEQEQRFINYTDTARLAHEILFDNFYIQNLIDNGVTLK